MEIAGKKERKIRGQGIDRQKERYRLRKERKKLGLGNKLL